MSMIDVNTLFSANFFNIFHFLIFPAEGNIFDGFSLLKLRQLYQKKNSKSIFFSLELN